MTIATREDIAKGNPIAHKDFFPDPEFCVPYECGYAGHSWSDLPRARRQLKHFKDKQASSGKRTSAKYDKQVKYWEGVVHQLECGRTDVVERNILQKFSVGGTT